VNDHPALSASLPSQVSGVADDRALLLARVDELSVVVAAMLRAAQVSRVAPGDAAWLGGSGGDGEHHVLALWNGLRTDVQYLRAAAVAQGVEADRLRHEGVALGVEVAGLREALAAAGGEVERVRAEMQAVLARAEAAVAAAHSQVVEWRLEAEQLRTHRDAVVGELLAVQRSRWVRLGRWVGVGARGRRGAGV